MTAILLGGLALYLAWSVRDSVRQMRYRRRHYQQINGIIGEIEKLAKNMRKLDGCN